MKRLRIRVVILACWLVFFYFISWLLDPIAFNPITIGLIFATLVMALIIPNLPRVSLWVMMLIPITALLVTKYWQNALSGNLAILLTIVEIFAIAMTMILARWVSIATYEFENTVADITLGPREKKLESTPLDQGMIYREVRRARNHQRPLALISVGVDEKAINPAKERMVQEIQQSMMKQYKLRVLSKILCADLEDCAIIVQDADRFLVVLPETVSEDVPIVIKRLRQKAIDQVGVDIKIGVATLPGDSYTYEGLVERASRDMESDRGTQPYLIMSEHPIDSRINMDPPD